MTSGENMQLAMEILLERCLDDEVAHAALADIFDRLIWCLSDNGADLLVVREQWLRSSNKRKVTLALLMNEVFPFESAEEMNQQLGQVAERWQDLRPLCDNLIRGREKQNQT